MSGSGQVIVIGSTHPIVSVPRSRTSRPSDSLALCLPLVVLSNSSHALVVAVHAIYALTCFGEYQLVDAIFADFALETMSMVGVVAGHDSLV